MLLGWNGSWAKAPAWFFLELPMAILLYLDDDHEELWHHSVYTERDRLAAGRREEETMSENSRRATASSIQFDSSLASLIVGVTMLAATITIWVWFDAGQRRRVLEGRGLNLLGSLM